jgi:hypothetical protein
VAAGCIVVTVALTIIIISKLIFLFLIAILFYIS